MATISLAKATRLHLQNFITVKHTSVKPDRNNKSHHNRLGLSVPTIIDSGLVELNNAALDVTSFHCWQCMI